MDTNNKHFTPLALHVQGNYRGNVLELERFFFQFALIGSGMGSSISYVTYVFLLETALWGILNKPEAIKLVKTSCSLKYSLG